MTNTANPNLLEAPPAPATPGSAIFSFVLGIFSAVGLVLTGVPAIIFGHVALARIRRSPIRLNGKTFAVLGIIMGWLSIIVTVVITGLIALGLMAVPKFNSAVVSAANDRAMETATQLKSSIGAYYEEFGSFPFPESTSAEGAIFVSNSTIMNPLTGKDNPEADNFFPKGDNQFRLFTDPGTGLSERDGKVNLIDPWGNPYHVKLNTASSNREGSWKELVTVWSLGRDEEDGTEDDVVAKIQFTQDLR